MLFFYNSEQVNVAKNKRTKITDRVTTINRKIERIPSAEESVEGKIYKQTASFDPKCYDPLAVREAPIFCING